MPTRSNRAAVRAAVRPATPSALVLAAAAGLALVAGHALAQGDPLAEPFPAVFELADLLPAQGGDGSLGSVFEANLVRAWFGWAAAGAGDLNNDGLADIVIGAREVGQAYVVFGSTEGFAAVASPAILTGGNGFAVSATGPTSGLGNAAGAAGDVNGDGIGDAIFGAFLFDEGGINNSGAAFVVFGRGDGGFASVLDVADLDGTNGFAFFGVDEDGQCGYSVGGIGDINGDGLDDIAIGANLAGLRSGSTRGEAYIVFGRTDGFPAAMRPADLDGTNGLVIETSGSGRLGHSIARLGDTNGDGRDDVAIGSPFSGSNQQGEVHVLYGRDAASPFPASIVDGLIVPPVGFKLVGTGPGDRVGWALGDAGDVDHDGISDLVIGVYSADPGGRTDAGTTSVVYGRDVGGPGGAEPFPASLALGDLDGTEGFRIEGVNMGDLAGLSASAGGDANGDGIDDILIGAFGLDPGGREDAGGAYLVYGRDGRFPPIVALAALTEAQGVRFHGIDADDVTGRATNFVGDANGDGVADIILGAERAEPGGRNEAGEAYLIYGRGGSDPCPVDLDGDGALTIFDFLVFQGYFALGDPRADFDGDGELTIFDFLAYQNAFDLGCP